MIGFWSIGMLEIPNFTSQTFKENKEPKDPNPIGILSFWLYLVSIVYHVLFLRIFEFFSIENNRIFINIFQMVQKTCPFTLSNTQSSQINFLHKIKN